MKKTALAVLAFALPFVTFAQTATNNNTSTLTGLFTWIINFINTILVPLIFALAFLLFLFGVFKYFFSAGSNAEKNRTEGKQFIMYAIIGFFVMITIWGLVNIVVRTIPGLENQSRPCLPTFGAANCETGSGSTQPKVIGQ
jgi:heme/copper-type cytochrome/quinol oxidase subunit 2